MKYSLFDLRVDTIGDPESFNCAHTTGPNLEISGENVRFSEGVKQFSHYVLASLSPYIAAKQRADQANDWMYFESEIACPDPLCGARFKIVRLARQSYEYQPLGK